MRTTLEWNRAIIINTVGGNVNVGGMDRRASLAVLYPASSDNDTLDAQAPLLDDRGIKSSHDCLLYTVSTKANKRHSAEVATYLIKNVLETLLSECGALYILDRTKFTCETLSLFRRNGPLFLPLQLLHHLRVIA
jgi:hypothetical protein